MKRFITLLLICLLMMTSCKKEVFSLEDKYYHHEELIELNSYEDFKTLEDNKESFAIFVYLPSCSTCAQFKPIIKQFIGINEMTFYTISLSLLKDIDNSITDHTKYAPTVLLYENGNVVSYLDTTKDEHIPYYETLEGFTEWFKTYCEIKVS